MSVSRISPENTESSRTAASVSRSGRGHRGAALGAFCAAEMVRVPRRGGIRGGAIVPSIRVKMREMTRLRRAGHSERRIVGIANIEQNENMEFACPPSIPPSGDRGASRVGRCRFGGPQIPRHTLVGEPRVSAPTRHPASLVMRPKLTSADRFLWAWLCQAWSDWRSSFGHRQTGNRDCLASQGLPGVLDLKSSSRPWPALASTDQTSRRTCALRRAVAGDHGVRPRLRAAPCGRGDSAALLHYLTRAVEANHPHKSGAVEPLLGRGDFLLERSHDSAACFTHQSRGSR